MGFEAPLALLGLLAVSVPILAHLVKRRDLPLIELPTVALLLRAQAQSRRRMRLVDLLLLAARMLMVALLALAVADPYLTAQLAYGDGRIASVAVVVDDSMSMGRGDGRTLVDEAVERAGAAIEALPEGSEVAVVLAGAPARLLVPRTEDREAAVEALEGARSRTARGTAMPEAVAIAARELHGARHDARRMLVLTDAARHAAWPDVPFPGSDVAVEVRSLAEEAETANRAITAAIAVPDPTTEGTASVSVEVRSFGAPDGEVDVALRRGEEELERQTVELVQGVGRATLHGPLIAEGDPSAEVALLGEDALATDDRRAVLLRPPSSLRVLLVDGDPHTSRDRSEVGFVARALEAAPSQEGAIGYRVVDPDTLASTALSAFDVVVLANAPAPPPHVAERLGELVERGGGVLIAAGDRFDPRAWVARLDALLPARPRADAPLDPPLALEAAPEGRIMPRGDTGLAQVQVHRRLLLEPPVGDGRVELRFSDGAPALVVGTHGAGRTAILATTIDAGWTDLPYRPGFLPLITRLLSSLSPRSQLPDAPIEPGHPVEIPAVPGATRMVVQGPDGRRTEQDGDEPLEVTDTELAGAYRVLVATRSAGLTDDVRAAFVVAPPAEESDLSPGELPEAAAGAGEGEAERGAAVKRSLAPWLFVLAGLLAVGEALLRVWRPRTAGARIDAKRSAQRA